jgi:hypothetical protein
MLLSSAAFSEVLCPVLSKVAAKYTEVKAAVLTAGGKLETNLCYHF